MKIGIIAAMDEEIAALLAFLSDNTKVDSLFSEVLHAKYSQHDLYICKSGIGKVNAALATMQLKTQYDVEYIINIGSAGGLKSSMNVYDVLLANAVCYHDVDVTAFGYQMGQVPQLPVTFIPDMMHFKKIGSTLQSLGITYHEGLVISGDQFIQNNHHLEKIQQYFELAMCVEMEAAAIAQTCHVLNLPFQIIRAISDVPNNSENHIDFKQFLDTAATNSAKASLAFVEAFDDASI